MSIKTLINTIFAFFVFVPVFTMAAIQEHTFSVSGDNGETGTGSFTWDDALVPNGDGMGISDVSSLSISISGGTVIGGSTTFSLPDCTQAYLDITPDFTQDINFWCDNGVNSVSGIAPFTNTLNSDGINMGTSTLTFSPGATGTGATAVPTMSAYGLALTVLGLFVIAIRRLRIPIGG